MTKTVFLTGASGFIAKHIVVRLLNAGYAVRGSVRSANKGDQVRAAVKPLVDAELDLAERLSFVELDLAQDAGWNEAMQGCDALLHTASPFPLQQPKSDDEIVKPAVEGTLRALKGARAVGVDRVVMTSSAVAVMYGDLPAGRDSYNEGDWSDDFHPTQNAYGRSKTRAERAAWDFVDNEAPSMKLTTINPVLVLGPALDRHYGTSLQVIERIFAGNDPMQPNFGLPIVDVRDVAKMHVTALERDDSIGQRILASDDFLWMAEIATLMKNEHPERSIKTATAPDLLIKFLSMFDKDIKTIIPQLGVRKRIDNARAKALLGLDFIRAEDSVLASTKSLVEFGR